MSTVYNHIFFRINKMYDFSEQVPNYWILSKQFFLFKQRSKYIYGHSEYIDTLKLIIIDNNWLKLNPKSGIVT